MKESEQLPPTTISDEELVARILQGEKNLYEILIRKFNLRLYRITMAIVNDDDEAEDVMQTTYLNAYLQLSSFEGRSSFGTWLTRIAINESLLHKKQKKRSDELLLSHAQSELHNESPLKYLMNRELKVILETAISNLPEKYKLVFIMREIQQMSIQETMEILDVGKSNVKVRLNRAKEMLRVELSSYYQSTPLFDFDLVRCDRVTRIVLSRILEQ
ncbi:RNA polymerase sigma-70 factor (ECF subfamily) [Dyadobacter sp. BE34]|uniref:RNA polymerase sigma-70 factor (ECF subfamily) n=1 Tax=Dyadobacter fermentans TaxID=94254 RepID=A0ABU1QVV6_9BACT|nr:MULTISPECIES: RNA polymerase sigma factor [Dyadobacter]MDR6804789.1 RNA polymerase sigma-70 factor (ECF subfamily) [Dyadobacter fermentans]MDR7043452.1 RNA polymerase sigma-70 factor (ECF subfamily) [Dyadobacter sp. BE242]MDR7197764.1 RNA polymerase sigma-70 factor (ECF subfamily) [Dyadobacter sp. BE34]MDR7214803.1 RNA polymerase sigma-70 factor (ECF subfamily) [Dyadobacter sp. BE31]MDR7262338.1 RNA polymerase sigma-70 factor (ECF subfamily) [Dyadobacter sp. BE32]